MQCREKAPTSAKHLCTLIRKVLVIVSRPARLLECLEFDPEEFYRFLQAAEGEAKVSKNVISIPQYIIGKLGLNQDPLSDISPTIIMDEKEFERQETTTTTTPSATADGTPLADLDESHEGGEVGELKVPAKLPSEDDYEMIKLISNGAYGAVYLVRHIETRQRFAMKKINKHNLVMRNQVEQVFAERDIMSFTDNPFVVSMLCSFETKKHLCMVMEYVEGGDCATLLKHIGPFPLDLARLYFAETVLAVEYLHSFGIVHRDLKPDNLLITALGHIKLTDFGLSKMGLMNLATSLSEGYYDRESQQFTDKQVFGTPEYLAPEVILKQGYAKTVDWWSLGVILYEFLIGCVPFFGETPEELFAHVINDSIEWPDEEDWPLTDESKDVITRLLEHSPFDRLGAGGSAEVKAHPFFDEIDWDSLLRQKAEFVPQLDGEDDTSYFDTRSDRYNHECVGEGEEDSDDGHDTDDSSLFGSFSSCSPRYHRVYSVCKESGVGSFGSEGGLQPEIGGRLRSSTSSSSLKDVTTTSPNSPNADSNTAGGGPNTTSASSHHLMKAEMLISRSLSVTEDRLTSSRGSNSNSPKGIVECKPLSRSLLGTVSTTTTNSEAILKIPLSYAQSTPAKSSSGSGGGGGHHGGMGELRLSPLSKSTDSATALSVNSATSTASTVDSGIGGGSGSCSSADSGNKPKHPSLMLPKFSFSVDDSDRTQGGGGAAHSGEPSLETLIQNLSSGDEAAIGDISSSSSVGGQLPSKLIAISGLAAKTPNNKSRAVIKSASASGLSLIIPSSISSNIDHDVNNSSPASAASSASSNHHHHIKPQVMCSSGGSNASSRDASPNREMNSLSLQLKPPIILRKGPRGFGFSLKAIRVYYGESDYYTINHLVQSVKCNSPAFEAGLRPGDLITHINGESIQGLLHHQVNRDFGKRQFQTHFNILSPLSGSSIDALWRRPDQHSHDSAGEHDHQVGRSKAQSEHQQDGQAAAGLEQQSDEQAAPQCEGSGRLQCEAQ